jgi:outer membrane murein-binding lipoprotein Lpp
MKKSSIVLFAAIICVLLTSCGYSQDVMDEKDGEITQLQSEITTLKGQLIQLKKDSDDNSINSEGAQDVISNSVDEINSVIQKIEWDSYSNKEGIVSDLKNVSVMSY